MPSFSCGTFVTVNEPTPVHCTRTSKLYLHVLAFPGVLFLFQAHLGLYIMYLVTTSLSLFLAVTVNFSVLMGLSLDDLTILVGYFLDCPSIIFF